MLVPTPSPESRQQFVDDVLHSGADCRLIVAGPGTGKSYLFGKEVEKHPKTPLVISFLRTLVVEMEPKLGAKAQVRTFHSFCKREFLKLHADKRPGFRFHYPPIATILDRDLLLTDESSVSVAREIELAMHGRAEHPLLVRWLQGAERYRAYGHTDLVYRVLACVEEGDELPTYPVVIVDEYQDFSPLERAFIERLAEGSPTLIVGDDDQALYAFKAAGPDGIRSLYSSGKAKAFSLPYCSRCTTVIVDAVHTLVAKAKTYGLLANRIDKPFECYTPDKRPESLTHPKIVHAACSVQKKNTPHMARYIEEQIAKIPDEAIEASWKEGYPSVLVIGPNPFRDQVFDYLQARLPNVTAKATADLAVERSDAIRILAQDPDADLGWRLVCHTWPNLEQHVKAFCADGSISLRSLLPAELVDEVLGLVGNWQAYQNGADVRADEAESFQGAVGVSLQEMQPSTDIVESQEEEETGVSTEDRTRPRVLCTSFQGAKGLSADYVFVLGMNAGHFPRGKVSVSKWHFHTAVVDPSFLEVSNETRN